ncbi:MAG TPA: hypothetical protein VGO30_11605 [Mycobacterium sp.]|jgi:hypothetical protein|nr:hypothetical protein [Mycobacterium sp.]
MKQKNTRFNRIRVHLLGIIGIGALAVMAVLGIAYGDTHGSGRAVAGSGDAPANTTYTQPSVAGATMGATATWTTPTSVMPTEKAVPPVKAGS